MRRISRAPAGASAINELYGGSEGHARWGLLWRWTCQTRLDEPRKTFLSCQNKKFLEGRSKITEIAVTWQTIIKK